MGNGHFNAKLQSLLNQSLWDRLKYENMSNEKTGWVKVACEIPKPLNNNAHMPVSRLAIKLDLKNGDDKLIRKIIRKIVLILH